MKPTLTRLCLCIFLLFFPLLISAASFRGLVSYSHPCKGGTIVEIRINNSGNAAIGLALKITFDPSDFQVTAPGPFTQVGQGQLFLDNISLVTDIDYAAFSFKGDVLNPSGFDFEVVLTENGLPVQTALVPVSAFQTVDGSTPVLLSDVLSQPNSPLLDQASAQTNAQKVFLKGTLIIDVPYHFIDEWHERSEIAMEKQARIIVKKDVDLTIWGSQVYGCADRWDAIQVMAGGELEVGYSSIEDARHGIELDGHNQAGLPLTDVDVSITTFRNNVISIYAAPASIGESNTQLLVRGSYFQGDGTNTIAGVYLHDVPSASFVLGVSGANFVPNRFIKFTQGVRADHSEITLDRPQFLDNQYGILAENGSILTVNDVYPDEDGDTFKENKTGIRSVDGELVVSGCSFNGNPTGIDVTSVLGLQTSIQGNYFTFSKYGIKVFAKTAAAGEIQNNSIRKKENTKGYCLYFVGESTSANSTWDITHNELAIFDGGLVNTVFLGAENIHFKENVLINLISKPGLRMFRGYNNEVECNLVDASEGFLQSATYNSSVTCNVIDASETAYQVQGLCEYTSIRGNTLDGNTLDLLYGSYYYPLAITGRQPAFPWQQHAGNLFQGAGNFGVQALHFGNISTALMSQYRVSSQANSDYLPTNSASTSYWFVDTSLPSTGVFDCATHDCELPFSGFAPDPRDEDYAFKDETITLSPVTDEIHWTGHQHLYRRLAGLPGIHRDFQSYYSQKTLEDVGKLAQFSEDLDAGTSFSASQQQALAAAYVQKESAQRALWNYLEGASKGVDPDSISYYKAPILQQNDVIEGIWSQTHHSLKGTLSALQAQNAAITSTELPAQHERTLNALLLSMLSRNEYLPTASEITALEGIAGQCPAAGGEAVFRARGLLSLTDSLYEWDDDASCGPLFTGRSRNAAIERTDLLGLVASPNPVRNTLVLTPVQPLDQAGSLEILNLQGQVIYQSSMTGRVNVRVEDWAEGLYLARLMEDGKAVQSVRFVVQR